MNLTLACLVVFGAASPVHAPRPAAAPPAGMAVRGLPEPLAIESPAAPAQPKGDEGNEGNEGTEGSATTDPEASPKGQSAPPAVDPNPPAPTPEPSAPAPAASPTDDTSASGDVWVAGGDDLAFDFDALAAESGVGDTKPADAGANIDKTAAAPVKQVSPADGGKKKRTVKAGDILSGALRMTGAFMHFRELDIPPAYADAFPTGDDGFALGEGRFIINTPAGEHLRFDINTFVDVSRAPSGGTLAGAFTSASSGSVYRTRYLRWNYWNNGAVSGNLGVDRLAMSILAGPVKIDVGRFPLNYTVTGVFTPNDVFAPFAATTVNRIFKPGVDALRVSVAAGKLASVDVMGVMGYGSDDAPTWGRTALFARAGFVGGGWEWGVLGGKLAERWVVGGSAQGDIGPLGMRTEFHVGFPDAEGDGRKETDEELPIYTRISGGPNLSWGWHNTSVSAEYMFVSDGKNSPERYLQRLGTLLPDDIPYLGEHYAAASFGLDTIPILRVQSFGMFNLTDGSGLAGLTLLYNAANEVDVILGAFVPWGRRPQIGEPPPGSAVPTFTFMSEFGVAALTVYLETRVFF